MNQQEAPLKAPNKIKMTKHVKGSTENPILREITVDGSEECKDK